MFLTEFKFFAPTLALAAFALPACTQQTADKLPQQPSETLIVVGTATPVPLAESTVAVTLEQVQPALLTLGSEQDLLRRDSSLVLTSRGAGGGQADISIRGGSFGQALVLVNGFRVNDGQTGHHNLDLPLPMEALHASEVLHGAGSTLHGEDALAGVVALQTAAPAADSLWLRSGYGSFNTLEDALRAAVVRKRWSASLTGNRAQSDGFTTDRDFVNQAGSVESWIGSKLGTTDLLLAASDRAFGANGFYGAYASWERTKSWFAAVRQDLGAATQAAFAYRRHTDDFVLIRSNPAKYENNHETTAWQASVRRRNTIVKGSSILLTGIEASGDGIRSLHLASGVTTNALGVHARNRGAAYADLDLRPADRRWSFSAGVREAIFSGGRTVFSPHVAGGYRLAANLKARASVGYGFRIPTYTDLYYADPATQGDPKLKPESVWSGEAGADWTPLRTVKVSATGFYARQHQTIDYVRVSTTAKWQAANLSSLRFAGAELAAEWRPSASQSLRLAYTGLAGQKAALAGFQSRYALNYPVANATATWTATVKNQLTVTNSLRVVQIYQQPGQTAWNAVPYPVWAAAVARDRGRIRPYLRFDNLANTGYQEISGVAMPGRAVTGGVVVFLTK